jgi:hypothetical protein
MVVKAPSSQRPTVEVPSSSDDDLPPLLSAAQSVLKGLITPVAFSTGALDNGLREVKKAVEGEDPLTFNDWARGWEAGSKNVNELWSDGDPIFGKEILEDTFEVEEEMLYAPAAFASNIPGLQFLARTRAMNKQAEQSIPVGTNTFWGGLAIDIAADPLTFLPAGAISTPIKVGYKTGRSATRAGRLAARGDVSASRQAGKLGVDEGQVDLKNIYTPDVDRGRLSGQIRIPENLQNLGGAASMRMGDTAKKLSEKYTYKTTKSSANRGFGETVADIIASSLDAGTKAAKAGVISASTKKFLENYARQSVKQARKQKKSVGAAAAVIPAKAIENAAIKNSDGVVPEPDEKALSASVPAEDGTKIELEAYKTYVDDETGEAFVFDGEDVYKFNQESDAQSWVDIKLSPAGETIQPVVSKQGKGWKVRVGSQVDTFATKKEADAWARAVETGQAPTRARVSLSGAKPIVDSAPVAPAVEEVLSAPTTGQGASALKTILKDVNKIAKQTKGLTASVAGDLKTKIRRVLSPQQIKIDRFLMNLPEQDVKLLDNLLAAEITPFEIIELGMGSQSKTRQGLASLIRSVPINARRGQMSLGTAYDEMPGAKNFAKLTEVYDGKKGTALQKQATAYIKENIIDRRNDLIAGKVVAATTPDAKYDSLKAVAGQEIADKIKATGYLAEVTPQTTKKFNQLLNNLSEKGQEIAYESIDDLIKGVERGDEISLDSLNAIFKAIDPEGKLVSTVEQAAGESANAFLARVLVKEGGFDTIREARRRLELAGDVEVLVEGTGLGYGDIIAGYIKESPKNPGVDEALELRYTRAAAAERLNNSWQVSGDQIANALNRAIMGDASEGGAGGIMAKVEELAQNPTAIEEVSTLGDLALRNTEKPFAPGSEAIFTRQLNQSVEVKVIGSLLGTTRAREIAGDVSRTANERMALLIEQLEQVEDMTTALGMPLVRTKNVKDNEFTKSFMKASGKAAEEGRTVNWSAFNEKHTVYLPMNEILSAVTEFGGQAALLRGFFPKGMKTTEQFRKGTLDWYSLGDASRRVLEMHQAGEPINMQEIAARLMARGEGRAAPSAAQKKRLQETAAEIAEILTKPETVTRMRNAHLERAASLVKDYRNPTETLSRDLFETLRGGWRARFVDGDTTEAARIASIREWFRKFVYASDVMRFEGGDIAETMFRASAMVFANGGKLMPESTLSGLSRQASDALKLIDQEELGLFREALHKYYRAEKPNFAAPAGRERTKAPTPKQKTAAQNKLTEAELAYGAHMKQFEEIVNQGDDAIRAWERTKTGLQRELDKARNAAWKAWLPTRHYHKGKWIPSERFVRDEAINYEQQRYAQYVAGQRGLEARETYLVDSVPEVPPHKKLSKSEKAKWLEKTRLEQQAAQVEKTRSIIDDHAANIADEFEAGRFDEIGDLTPTEAAQRAAQEQFARTTLEATQMPMVREVQTQYGNIDKGNIRQYLNLDEDTPLLEGDILSAKFSQLGERLYGPQKRKDVIQVMHNAESTALGKTSMYADYLDGVRRKWARSISSQQFNEAFDFYRNNHGVIGDFAVDDFSSETVYNFFQDIRKPLDILFKEFESSAFMMNGIDGKALQDAMARYGLTTKTGFKSIQDYSSNDLVTSLLDDMPFGSAPSKLDTEAAADWIERKKAFDKAFDVRTDQGLSQVLVLTRLMEAVQATKFEKGMAETLTARFGHKTQKLSKEEAIKEGWVKIDFKGAENVARFIPEDELFHPNIAEQMGSLLREYNEIYTKPGFGPIFRSVMNAVGFLKSTQTILRLGHHVTNIVGDTTAAMIAGTRNPAHWGMGTRLAGSHAKTRIKADYSQVGRDLDAKFAQSLRVFEDAPRALDGQVDGQPGIAITVYDEAGKPKKQVYSDEEIIQEFERRGILITNIYANDIQGIIDGYMSGASTAEATLFEKFAAKVQKTNRAIQKAPGDVTAYYGNVTRSAHALSVIQSRSWKSLDDAMQAAADRINMYHPTIQSLASGERKWGRLLFTYYTWIRVAHVAFLDMAANHAGAMLTIPKAMYNYQQMQGFDPTSPAVPFSDKNRLPSYMSYSVYGPNAVGPQGARVVRPSFLPLDILDFWQINIDPTKNAADNALSAASQTGRQIGENISFGAAPAAALLFGYDIRTGGRAPQTLEEARDASLSYLGFSSLLTALAPNLYTPERYKDNENNPLTDADRQRLLQNWLSGLRISDVNREANLRRARTEDVQRERRVEEQKKEEFKKFAEEEGLTPQQILDLIRKQGGN